ncbi:MAG TPA: uroporphyrinogen-III synthase [Acidimicrobiales bacterium]
MDPVPELSGFAVGVTADRRADEQSLMLSRLGLDVVWGPAIRTLPVADDARLRIVTEAIIAEPPDYVVANTGVGVRSWLGMAASWGLEADLRTALRSARIAARGPKAAGATQIAGLEVWWRAPNEQLSSVADRLIDEGIAGRRVAVQLHGDDQQGIAGVLREAGAEVTEVPVYRWTLPEDVRPAQRLIEQCCTHRLDAVTFTAGPAAQNLFRLAATIGRREELLAALNGPVLVACVGPVCAGIAMDEGISEPVIPEHWRLGSLVRLVADRLWLRRRAYRVGTTEMILQGSVAVVDGNALRLTDRERAVLTKLVDRAGATVTRSVLLRDIWQDPGVDSHVLDMAVRRLRTKLGPGGEAIETAVRRGYRFSATELPQPR